MMHFSFKKRSFVVITGASRGIGKSIALHFCERCPASSVFVLMSRNVDDLEKTKSEMQAIVPNITVITQTFDQGSMEQGFIDSVFRNILSKNNLNTDMFDQSIIVHNVGIIGDLSILATGMRQLSTVRSVVDTNLVGMVLLNSAFFQLFRDSSRSRLIVNISSGASVMSLPFLSLYCSVKAARDMYYQVLAKETPSIRVLTYDPGVVDTDMMRKVRDTCPEEYREAYCSNAMITPAVTVEAMIKVLEENKFESGTRVCYDVPPPAVMSVFEGGSTIAKSFQDPE